jgi:murein DD-endopeptidase MepM/ murein hydrolase activator NlpD
MSATVVSVLLLFFSYNFIKERGRKEARLNNEQTEAKLKEQIARIDNAFAVMDEVQYRDDNVYRLIFGADPFPSYKRELGVGGNQKKYASMMDMAHGELIVEISKKLDILEKRIVAQSISFDSVVAMAKNKEKLLQAIPSIQPISNVDLTRIASGYGYRMHPIYKIMKMHTGIDFTADIGTPIFATGDGVVEKTETMSGYGQLVVLNHGFGYQTRYAHVSEYKCKPGQKVKRGDIIALVGNTGASVGPHLHYEVFFKGNHVNPVNFFFNDLSPEEFEQVITISSRPTQSM